MKKRMFIALCLSAVLAFSVCGCSSGDDKKEDTPIKIDEQGEAKPVEIVNKLDN